MKFTPTFAWITCAVVLSGQPFDPVRKLNVPLFVVMTDCALSNAYAPEVQSMCNTCPSRAVDCILVYEDLYVKGMEDHPCNCFQGIHATFDADRSIARRAGALATPEAVIVDTTGTSLSRPHRQPLCDPRSKTSPCYRTLLTYRYRRSSSRPPGGCAEYAAFRLLHQAVIKAGTAKGNLQRYLRYQQEQSTR